MAYNKKTWEDNVSDVTAAELNRMEQGIYDNSLTVDAVNANVNPNGEVSLTTTLTEGQILDVIKVSNIQIKGNTAQEETPTVSSTVDVNVVSGSNIFNINNKNIYDASYRRANNTIYVNAATITENEGVFSMVATGQDMYMWKVKAEGNDYEDDAGKLYKFIENNYNITVSNTAINHNNVTYYDKDKKSLGYIVNNDSNFNISKTDKVGAEYFSIRFGKNPATINTTYNFSIQLEPGTVSTQIVLHEGKEYSLDLDTIELCKVENYQDYIYKNNEKWYLHKENTKIYLTAEDDWQTDTTPSSNPRRFIRNASHIYITPANNDTIVTAKCNYPIVSATNTSAGTASGVAIHPNGSVYISADVFSNLSTDSITMYIPLITATDTEITDTDLISQLEELNNASLYEQTNIVQENNDLQAILNIIAFKDNINGIKAWIRK